jgi:hypothetical protein
LGADLAPPCTALGEIGGVVSLDRQSDLISMCCDDCGDTYSVEHADDDFQAFIAGAKAEGWRIYKSGDEWLHRCPDCQHKRRSLG